MKDVCVCGHLLQAHDEGGACHSPCVCAGFVPEDVDELEAAA